MTKATKRNWEIAEMIIKKYPKVKKFFRSPKNVKVETENLVDIITVELIYEYPNLFRVLEYGKCPDSGD